MNNSAGNGFLAGQQVVQGISTRGVRRLVKHLPKLEYINFGWLGQVLDGIEEAADPSDQDSALEAEEDQALESRYPSTHPLKLTLLTEHNPRFVSPTLLADLCPALTHLCLTAPLRFVHGQVTSPHLARCNGVSQGGMNK